MGDVERPVVVNGSRRRGKEADRSGRMQGTQRGAGHPTMAQAAGGGIKVAHKSVGGGRREAMLSRMGARPRAASHHEIAVRAGRRNFSAVHIPPACGSHRPHQSPPSFRKVNTRINRPLAVVANADKGLAPNVLSRRMPLPCHRSFRNTPRYIYHYTVMQLPGQKELNP